MKYLKVNNWEKFQHYKDRCPPWIKLHRELLRDYDFLCLQDASKLQLMLIWLLASQMENKIPADEEFIRKQIGITGKIDLKELINKGFLIDDSGLLASCKQSAMLETETETETETESYSLFEKFWNNWKPYEMEKGNKKSALKKYLSVVKKVNYEVLENKANEYCLFCEKTRCKTKHVITWLNQNSWEDEYSILPKKEFSNYTELSAREQAERLIM